MSWNVFGGSFETASITMVELQITTQNVNIWRCLEVGQVGSVAFFCILVTCFLCVLCVEDRYLFIRNRSVEKESQTPS